jgi:filamentous hemagglutinin family protein
MTIDGFRKRLFAACLLAHPAPLWANPTVGDVVAGSAGISSSGNTLTVTQASNNAIIDWRGFSIGQGELTRFIQPSAQSSVLNRVTGGDPSAIYGTLQANGRVFLINPNGITVGPTGVIDTQSFVASTLDLNNDDFIAGGALLFSGSSAASLINAGRISALGGDVILIARTVRNTGEILATEGTAALAAGTEVLIQPSGDERVFVKAGGDEKAAVGVDQRGRIAAATAELKAAGGNVYSLAINNSGIVQATGVRRCGGRVYLVAEGGGIALKTGSVIDASGANGGGAVLVGGDSEGLNPDVPNASVVTIEGGAAIKADALENGDGGKVVVWGTKAASFKGAISAKGGAQSGNGGSVEVSGGYLDFRGKVDVTAPKGSMGSLLLDPFNMTISNQPQSGIFPCGCDNELVDVAIAEGSNLQDTFLVEQLTNANVTIKTDANGLETGGDITIAGGANAANLTWSNVNGADVEASGTLTLRASRNITVEAGAVINATNHGGVAFIARRGKGKIDLNADVTTNGGAQTYDGRVTVRPDNVVLTSNGGAIRFLDTLNGRPSGRQSLTIDRAGSVTFDGHVGAIAPLRALRVFGKDIVMGGDVFTSGAGGVLMVAENSFKNPGSHAITAVGGGRFLIYSADPARNILGGLAGSAQYGTTYRDGPAPGFSGNGFLYAGPAPMNPDPGGMMDGHSPFDGVGFLGGAKEPEDGRTYADAGDDNGSASSSDLFSWDLGTMRDAVASTEEPKRKKKKRK